MRTTLGPKDRRVDAEDGYLHNQHQFVPIGIFPRLYQSLFQFSNTSIFSFIFPICRPELSVFYFWVHKGDLISINTSLNWTCQQPDEAKYEHCQESKISRFQSWLGTCSFYPLSFSSKKRFYHSSSQNLFIIKNTFIRTLMQCLVKLNNP